MKSHCSTSGTITRLRRRRTSPHVLSDRAVTISKCFADSAGKPRYAIILRTPPSGPSTNICMLAAI